jgi:hypothetical protein
MESGMALASPWALAAIDDEQCSSGKTSVKNDKKEGVDYPARAGREVTPAIPTRAMVAKRKSGKTHDCILNCV